jgi:predicted 2-oxoglutarate/Fe(II)-dependent dioxygenase YbiX
VVIEMREAFCFTAASFEPLRIGCYDGTRGGHFGRHRDNRTPYTAHRSFAMSLNLNTGAYVGGQIRFPEFGRELYEADAGGAVVFSCNLLHEALPVTLGRRFALFTFFADAAGAAREQEMAAKQMAGGRRGVSVG